VSGADWETLVDVQRLAAWMDLKGLGSGPIEHPRRLAGGTQNLLLHFRRAGRDYVLRRPPLHPRQDGSKTIAREARVLGALAATSVSDYLSGLLIGAEVATLGQRYRTSGVTLVGDPALNARYSRAMRARGMTVNSCNGDEALLGGMARIMHEQD